MQQSNAAAISQSYDHSTRDLIASNAKVNEINTPLQAVPSRQEESGMRSRELRSTGSHAQDAAAAYRNESEWTPGALKIILPLIVILVVAGIGILKMWDLATPDTAEEMLVRGQTEQAIAKLESRQRTGKTSDRVGNFNTAYCLLKLGTQVCKPEQIRTGNKCVERIDPAAVTGDGRNCKALQRREKLVVDESQQRLRR